MVWCQSGFHQEKTLDLSTVKAVDPTAPPLPFFHFDMALFPHVLIYFLEILNILLKLGIVFLVPCACKVVEVMVYNSMPFFSMPSSFLIIFKSAALMLVPSCFAFSFNAFIVTSSRPLIVITLLSTSLFIGPLTAREDRL